MENSRGFAANVNGWVLWAERMTLPDGWINVQATPTKMKPGRKRTYFALGWNGERFSRSSEMERLERYDPEAEQLLHLILVSELPKTIH